MRYMIAPLDLNIKELEVYKLLYKKMDFDTFEVKYTLDQISQDSDKILELTKRKVDVIIKKFIELNYLNIVQKGVKGKPTIYKITKINELMCTEYVTNKEQICNEFRTNNEQINVDNTKVEAIKGTNNERIMNECVTNNEQICDEYVTPINDKDKEKEYIDEIWKLYPLKKGKKKAYDKIPKILKEIGKDKLIECINNYKEYIDSTKRGNWIQSYMGGDRFFNGMYLDYLEGSGIDKTTTVKEEKKASTYNPYIANKISSVEDAKALFEQLTK